MAEVFAKFQSASALRINKHKTVFVPLSSGDPGAAVNVMSNYFIGMCWSEVETAPAAVLIGIPVGPLSATSATTAPLLKCALRMKEIGKLGAPTASSFAFASILAVPVLHRRAQLY